MFPYTIDHLEEGLVEHGHSLRELLSWAVGWDIRIYISAGVHNLPGDELLTVILVTAALHLPGWEYLGYSRLESDLSGEWSTEEMLLDRIEVALRALYEDQRGYPSGERATDYTDLPF